jgi:hypothetical protein
MPEALQDQRTLSRLQTSKAARSPLHSAGAFAYALSQRSLQLAT